MKEKYFTTEKKDDLLLINDRLPFNFKNIFLAELSSFVAIWIFSNIFLALYISLLFTFFYIIFRYFASIYYSIIQINKKSQEFTVFKKFINKTVKEEVITTNVSLEKFNFITSERSGGKKFILNYSSHKNNELLVLKNEEDKIFIDTFLKENLSN